jgi:hypothetical protein
MARVPALFRRISWRWLALAALSYWTPSVSAASSEDARLHRISASLRPGEFIWDTAAITDEPPTISISVALQRIYVYRGDVLVGIAAVSTGRPGKETPLGDFRILQKAKWHRSNLYSNAPMPFMQRLTWDGIALHAGWNPGYPDSHGCIRLPAAFARALFEMTTLGSSVSVTDYPLDPPVYLRVAGLQWAAVDDMVMGGAIGEQAAAFPSARRQRAAFRADRMRSIRLDYAAAVFTYE